MVSAEGSQDSVEVMVKKGMFSFMGEQGKKYNILVQHEDLHAQTNVISLSLDDKKINKIVLAIEPDGSSGSLLTMVDESIDLLNSSNDSDLRRNNRSTNDENNADSAIDKQGSNRESSDSIGEQLDLNNSQTNSKNELAATTGGAMDLSTDMSDNYSTDVMSVVPPISYNNDKSPTLIVLNSDGSSAKYYILSDGIQSEIIEIDGKLCIRNQDQSFVFAQGSLDEFKIEPLTYLSKLGVKNPEIISLQNIYFDFNSVEIRNDSKKELAKAFKILHENPFLELVISGHADDRGRENYNQKLSQKRADAVKSFMIDFGINKERMISIAFGERKPVIPCQVQNCDENDHSKNRRAELTLKVAKPHTEVEDVTHYKDYTDNEVEKQRTENKNTKMSYGEILDKYGEQQISGLVFKISIGAYLHNPNLTFDNLQDLGNVQKKLVGGINYYFLAEYYDLKTAEVNRKEVINRGIYDAFISIYYKDKIIPFSTYLKHVQSNSEF
jgi:outer membrane protein OmpA-like peptidoglycan-associated protein